jgi:hypothetical protein
MEDEEQSSYLDETTESLLEQSQQNAQALILSTIAVLDDLGILPEAWAEGIGDRFSDAWGDDSEWEPSEFLDAMITNYRALGATVENVDFSEEVATADIFGFPDDELADVFGVSAASAAVFHRVGAEIARRRGLLWEWALGEESTAIKVTRIAVDSDES